MLPVQSISSLLRLDAYSIYMCRAAAEATGCKVEFKQRDIMYDLRQNSVLAEEFHAVGAARFGMLKTDQAGAIGGSTGTCETA